MRLDIPSLRKISFRNDPFTEPFCIIMSMAESAETPTLLLQVPADLVPEDHACRELQLNLWDEYRAQLDIGLLDWPAPECLITLYGPWDQSEAEVHRAIHPLVARAFLSLPTVEEYLLEVS